MNRVARTEFEVEATLPRNQDLGIAVVGAGAIVNAAHLPAYRQAGLNVVGITDLRLDRARSTARDFGIERVYGDLAELLDDPAVDIVDIAVAPESQPAIATRAAIAGKHLLCQKPLAIDFSDALDVVERASKLFDEVIVAVGVNSSKDPLLTTEQRMDALRKSLEAKKPVQRERAPAKSAPARKRA